MSYRYWWQDPANGATRDLDPLRGYEGKYCGGRHGGKFEDHDEWMTVEGGKRHHADRANRAKVRCRFCGDELHGTLLGVVVQEEEAGERPKPRSYQRREDVLRGREHRGRTITGYGGADVTPPVRDVNPTKSRAARIHAGKLHRIGNRRDPAPGGDRGYTGRHRGKVFDT